MKMYAQMGYGDGEKTATALAEGLIDGAIISPRDWRPEGIAERIGQLTAARTDADILLDPQFYASFISTTEMARTGKLADWPFFITARKSELELTAQVDRILQHTYEHLRGLPLTAIIAPNVYISRSFDSRDAVIAKNFIRSTKRVFHSNDDHRPVFATLAVSRDALLERTEFEEFLNDITMLQDPPDGFYVVVGSPGAEARTDIFHTDVIARWMLLNHSLRINGYKVINGYSDIIAPFLGAVGAYAGASGWWTNLRTFSLARFQVVPSGGRQPIARYLSVRLLNRVTFQEKEALAPMMPATTNGLRHDADYNPEPDRPGEALQSWEALHHLSNLLALDDTDAALTACNSAISRAQAAYLEIAEAGIALDRKSNSDHLDSLQNGIQKFKELAGLG